VGSGAEAGRLLVSTQAVPVEVCERISTCLERGCGGGRPIGILRSLIMV
jgi:hypothetical protein